MGFPPSIPHLQKTWSAAVEKTHCSHTFHKVNICTSKLFISLIPSHLHSKTPLAALVTAAGEDLQKCKHEKNPTEQIPRDAGDPRHVIHHRQEGFPRWSLGLCSALPAAQPTIPPSCCSLETPVPLLAQGTRAHVRTRRHGAGGDARLQE